MGEQVLISKLPTVMKLLYGTANKDCIIEPLDDYYKLTSNKDENIYLIDCKLLSNSFRYIFNKFTLISEDGIDFKIVYPDSSNKKQISFKEDFDSYLYHNKDERNKLFNTIFDILLERLTNRELYFICHTNNVEFSIRDEAIILATKALTYQLEFFNSLSYAHLNNTPMEVVKQYLNLYNSEEAT